MSFEVLNLTPDRIEYAYGLSQQAAENQWEGFKEVGLRAARARDPKLLRILERVTEHLSKLSEEQMGRTRRDASTQYSHRVEHTEVQLWREAYKSVDRGEASGVWAYQYGAAAWLAGYVHQTAFSAR